jgi:hypothetical protein
MEEVRIIKANCLEHPDEKLWRGATRHITEVRTIFHHLNSLRYEDKPDYSLIRNCLKEILVKNEGIPRPMSSSRNLMVMPPNAPAPITLAHQKQNIPQFMPQIPQI